MKNVSRNQRKQGQHFMILLILVCCGGIGVDAQTPEQLARIASLNYSSI